MLKKSLQIQDDESISAQKWQDSYYVVTDAVLEDPANMIGVLFRAADERLAGTLSAVDLFQFTNGINGKILLSIMTTTPTPTAS